ncbi:MAG: response regulator transcription factor, partial [Verrucomicrobia bacterium]|nr:response regulator transcription factor [Verrucomicrobiota bacterium]
SGNSFFPPAIRERLEIRMTRPDLTPRETEVLRSVVMGRSNKEIAAVLGIAEPTVKLHVRNLLDKLDALDRTQATTAAIQRGLVRL